VLADEDVEEQTVTKTTKIVDKSASATGLFVVLVTAIFFRSALLYRIFQVLFSFRSFCLNEKP